MAYGFRCYNENGKIQVDSNGGLGYALLTSGSVLTSNNRTYVSLGTWSDYGVKPIILFKPSSSGYFIDVQSTSNTTASIRSWSNGSWSGSSGTTVYYRVYIPVSNFADINNYGLRVRDGSNTKIFDSNYSVPKYTGLLVLPNPTIGYNVPWSQTPSTTALPPGTQANPWFTTCPTMSAGTLYTFGPPSGGVLCTFATGIVGTNACLAIVPIDSTNILIPYNSGGIWNGTKGYTMFIAND